MKIEKGNLISDFHRDTYWTRVYVESDESKRKTIILICASYEFFWDLLKTREFTKTQLNEWLDDVVEKWILKGENIFLEQVHYDVYSTTDEGKENGYDFLKNEVVK